MYSVGMKGIKMSIIAYCRTSSKGQCLEYQRKEIEKYLGESVSVDKWVEEQLSAKKTLTKSKLKTTLKTLKEGDILITSEISRLARDLDSIMDILRICISKGCEIWTIRENYKLKNDLPSKVILFAYGLTSELEHNLISQRTKNALDSIKSSGKKLGRPFSAKSKKLMLDENDKKLRKMLAENKTISRIAKELGVHHVTVQRYMERNGIEYKHVKNK